MDTPERRGPLHWMRRSIRRALKNEEGNSMVEMALVSTFVFLPMVIGIFEVSIGLYTYNCVCEAARQATRYASVRGAESCTIESSFVDCNLSPSTGTNPTSTSGSTSLTNYVNNLNYPGLHPANLTVTATWLSKTITSGTGGVSTTTWDTTCTTTDTYGQPCNTPGDAVRVKVSYAFPLPFWKARNITLASTSQMVINE